MGYPADIPTYTTKIDKSASGWYVSGEYFNVPLSSPYTMYLDHVPKDVDTTHVFASGGAEWTEVLSTPTAAGQFLVDYDDGKVTFYSTDLGSAIEARYTTLGDDIMAEHVNELQTEIENVETELGINLKAGWPTVGGRLNTMEQRIAASGFDGHRISSRSIVPDGISNDIMGDNWLASGAPTILDIKTHQDNHNAAHFADSIFVTPPGSCTPASVQGHIDSRGGVAQSDTNPHGVDINDLLVGDLDVPGSISVRELVDTNRVWAEEISCSGVWMGVNSDGPNSDSWYYFYNDTFDGEWLRWNNTDDQFELSNDIFLQGSATASGNIMPEASGLRTVGSQAVTFDTGSFDTMYAAQYTTGASTGANGSFTTTDGKTIKVESGIVVSIT